MTTVCMTPLTLGYPQGGGHLWVYVNWALSLQALGCRVVWLEDIGAEKSRQLNDGEVLVREAPKTLRVRINNLPPINEVAAIEYQVNDGGWRPLKDDSVNEWTGDLTELPWKPNARARSIAASALARGPSRSSA